MPLARRLSIAIERFALAETFTISRGSKSHAEVVVCTLYEESFIGRGECVPYPRYGESLAGVCEAIEAVRGEIEAGADRAALQALMPPGAARNALDCALWDLEAKQAGTPAHLAINRATLRPLTTAYTISLGPVEAMAAKARANAFRPLLKIKLGGEDDATRMAAIAAAAPDSRLIVDANEGWNDGNLKENLDAAARCRVALIEQPLPAGKDALLGEVAHPVPICADESVHTAEDLPRLKGFYEAVNIKLDKTGGLTAALELCRKAREQDFGVMVGCMVGTSLAMAPAVLLAQDADHVDLDGPLLLANDRSPALRYEGSLVFPPERSLWG